jgi:predicted DNA binding CopG/RHH family protein
MKKTPSFKNEDEERDFWDREDALDYFNKKKKVNIDISGLKPSTKAISLRLADSLLYELKKLANKYDVPYQSLIKIFLNERVNKELSLKR